MHDARGVRRRERPRDLPADFDTSPSDPLVQHRAQRPSFDELLDDVVIAFSRFAEVVDVTMFGWLSADAARASRRNREPWTRVLRRSPSPSRRRRGRGACRRTEDFAHAAAAEERVHAVWTEESWTHPGRRRLYRTPRRKPARPLDAAGHVRLPESCTPFDNATQKCRISGVRTRVALDGNRRHPSAIDRRQARVADRKETEAEAQIGHRRDEHLGVPHDSDAERSNASSREAGLDRTAWECTHAGSRPAVCRPCRNGLVRERDSAMRRLNSRANSTNPAQGSWAVAFGRAERYTSTSRSYPPDAGGRRRWTRPRAGKPRLAVQQPGQQCAERDRAAQLCGVAFVQFIAQREHRREIHERQHFVDVALA